MCSIPTRENKIFNVFIPRSGSESAQRRIPSLDTQCLQNSAESEERKCLNTKFPCSEGTTLLYGVQCKVKKNIFIFHLSTTVQLKQKQKQTLNIPESALNYIIILNNRRRESQAWWEPQIMFNLESHHSR